MTQDLLTDAATMRPAPPVAEKRPKVDVVHGERRVDDYFWLRDKANPEQQADYRYSVTLHISKHTPVACCTSISGDANTAGPNNADGTRADLKMV